MSNLAQAVWVEILKLRRSRLPWLTALGFTLIPVMGGFIMIVVKDPALARRVGIISAKAQLVAGVADWQTYLGLLAQATGVGGIMLFGLVASWVFGREYSDRTVKDLLALPTSRSAIVLAKFVVVASWSAALTAMIYLIGLVIGDMVALPPTSAEIFVRGTVSLALTAGLTIALVTPIAFFASAGHGYLPPLGVAMVALLLAQAVAAAGWGEYFPWSIPALYAGLAGKQSAGLGAVSFMIVSLTSLAGIVGTLVWWELVDQTH